MAKKVLITGGTGFIGHHLIEHFLLNTDWEFVCLDRLDTSGTLYRLHEVLHGETGVNHPEWKKRVRFVYHDLKSELNSFVANKIGKVDYILHLAAGSHVDRSIEDPMSFVMDNVVGTTNLLNFARTLDSLELLVNFSTDEVFGPAPEGVKYKEWDRYNSTNPYSASKAGAEEMCLAFANTYKLPLVQTHCMNVFHLLEKKLPFMLVLKENPERDITFMLEILLLLYCISCKVSGNKEKNITSLAKKKLITYNSHN
jgi:dTDP-glucose 4,6-dehydratase